MKTPDYFIEFFSRIPEKKWTTGVRGIQANRFGRYCALGHCGTRATVGGVANGRLAIDLSILFRSVDLTVAQVNDRKTRRFRQHSPKARILAALRAIKEGVK